MGGDGISIRVIKRNTETVEEEANMDSVVCCNFVCWKLLCNSEQELHDAVVVDKVPIEARKHEYYVIGEADAIPSLELSLRHSRTGDIFWMRTSHRFAYSSVGRKGNGNSLPESRDMNSLETNTVNNYHGSNIISDDDAINMIQTVDETAASVVPAIEPETYLEYLVEIVSISQTCVGAMNLIKQLKAKNNTDEVELAVTGDSEPSNADCILADVEIRRICGNRWFSYGEYLRASKCYAKGIKIAENYLHGEQEAASKQVEELENTVNETDLDTNLVEKPVEITINPEIQTSLINSLNNLAACNISLGDFKHAKEVCINVLLWDVTNIKVLKCLLRYLDMIVIKTISKFSASTIFDCRHYYEPLKPAWLFTSTTRLIYVLRSCTLTTLQIRINTI